MPIQLRRSFIAIVGCASLAAVPLGPTDTATAARHGREAAATETAPTSTVGSEQLASEKSGASQEAGSQNGASAGKSGSSGHGSNERGSHESGSEESGSTVPAHGGRSSDAQRHARSRGGCALTLQASSDLVAAGQTVTLSGYLACPGGIGASGETVTISQHQRIGGVSSPSELTAMTEADGSFEMTSTALTAKTVFVARSAFAHHNARTVVKVAPTITLEGPAASGSQLAVGRYLLGAHGRDRLAGNRFTFTGAVSPAATGAQVALQREYDTAGEQWRTIAFGRVGAEGHYSITHGFRIAGSVSVRVVAGAKGELRTASEPISYEIVQAQNPRLTIDSSADPTDSGEPVTIAGIATGAANQEVTLLSRTPGQPFAPVTKAEVGGGGAYTFTVAPTENTYYEVLDGAGETSSKLFQGVRYQLDPSAPPSTVQDGTQVSFSGTVVSAPPGQAVVLERQNGPGLGFHPVASGAVGVEGAYSIAYTFSGAGSRVMRLRIPGGAQTEGTTSAPFTIVVTRSEADASAGESSEVGVGEVGAGEVAGI